MLKLARGQRILQQIKDRPAKILRRRHAIGKQRIEIQVGVVEPVEHSRPHHFIQRHQVHHHSRLRIDRAAHQHLNKIVVAVAMLVVALSIGRAVLLPP